MGLVYHIAARGLIIKITHEYLKKKKKGKFNKIKFFYITIHYQARK
jgi:hypothetical protein